MLPASHQLNKEMLMGNIKAIHNSLSLVVEQTSLGTGITTSLTWSPGQTMLVSVRFHLTKKPD